MIASVVQFNERIRAGGGRLFFPTSHVSAWLPKLPDRTIFQEYFLALDKQEVVRGAYILKHRPFSIRGDVMSLGDFQLPMSEGIVDRKYVGVGVRLLRDALDRQPLLYALGMGGYEQALPRLLAASGWNMFSVPFFFRIVRPYPFLRNIVYLRRSPLLRCLIGGMAFSGLGWAVIKALQTVHNGRAFRAAPLGVEVVDEFQDWADDLWNAHRGEYGVCGERDSTSLQILYPRDERKFIRLKIGDGKRPVGWVVLLNTPLSCHKQFGNMQLGSIVDCFSSPPNAGLIIRCARAFLERQGVDLIVSNQAHACWGKALHNSGFIRGPSNFLFASSKKLAGLLDARGVGNGHIHMNRGDGDGPIHL
jgi:hypothetical protein